VGILTGWLAALCGSAAAAAPALPTADQNALVQGGAAFALDLYGQLASRPGNLFFSPYSVSSALAMTYGGAAGQTAEQMAKTLHLDLPSPRLHAAFGALNQALNVGGQKGGYSLSVANALWGQRGSEFLAPFRDLVRTGYGAGLRVLDFRDDAEGARKTINDWVAVHTNGKIKDLIAPGVLDRLTRLVLTDAIYFKGDWEREFQRQRTSDQLFYVKPGQTIQAPLMTQVADFGYLEGEGFQAVEMVYRGGDVALVAFLPRERFGLAALEKGLSADSLRLWLGRLQDQRVAVHFPRFKMTEQFALAGQLQALGMLDAFSSKADFSLMNGKRPGDLEALSISDVIHKAFVEVNEQGTEAAAATAVVMKRAMAMRPGPPVPEFRADHPFLFLIRDRRSGAILFLGRVVEPRS
jgi:serpin B